MFEAKKLVSTLATSALMAKANKKAENVAKNKAKNEVVVLKRVSCIYYPLCFQRNTANIRTLIGSGNEINVMTLVITSKLGLQI